MDNKPIISVVIPMYNCEDYIRRCIGSVLSQTYKNIECIVVDDGSTDTSLMICQELEKKDSRLQVYHIENGGVSAARNYGMSKTHGKFVTFVDSDDYIDSNVYENVVQSLNGRENVIVSYAMKKKIGNQENVIAFEHKDIVDDFINYPIYMHSVCNKIFPRLAVDNLRFDTDISVCEDFLFVFKAVLVSNDIIFCDNCYYHYEDNPNSASQIGLNEKWIADYEAVYERASQSCNKNQKQKYKKLLDYQKMYHAMVFLTCPEFYDSKAYREANPEKLVWTFTNRMDFFLMSLLSNVKIDCVSRLYVLAKNRLRKK